MTSNTSPIIEAAIAANMKPYAERCNVVIKDGRVAIVAPKPEADPNAITSFSHLTIGGKNYFVAYTEADNKFTVEPDFMDEARIGLRLITDESTGTYQQFLKTFENFIEFDKSYKTGVFDQYDNPIPLLKRACWEDLNFDNWLNNYRPNH